MTNLTYCNNCKGNTPAWYDNEYPGIKMCSRCGSEKQKHSTTPKDWGDSRDDRPEAEYQSVENWKENARQDRLEAEYESIKDLEEDE